MAFLMGMGGFAAALACYLIGFWRGRAAGRSREPALPPTPVIDEKRRQEWYNFLHYDGGRMPAAHKTDD